MANYVWFLIFTITSILHPSSQIERKCIRGLKTPGFTEPYGDILIEYGNPLDIICVLHNNYVQERGPNASKDLYFVNGMKDIPSEMIEILNSSSIKLHIEKPSKSINVYTCKLKDNTEAVCLNNVIVGTKPQPVTDFECMSYNYENLTCTWTPPQNYAKTAYNLSFYFPGRAGRLSRNYCHRIEPSSHNKEKLSCLWTIDSDPQYRQAQRTFYFELNMTNHFGTNQLNKTFSHFRYVLSNPPENLTCINTTSYSMFLKWSIPHAMQGFPPGLQHKVMYQSEYEKEWKMGGVFKSPLSIESKQVYFNLTGLKYAHALYDVRVSMRTGAAEPDDEFMWSNNASLTDRTMSKIPDFPPLTNIGSFEIVSSGSTLNQREVYVYWQQIPVVNTNGENFTYVVEVEGFRSLQPSELTDAYAKFQNLSIDINYTFNIWSENSQGRSTKKSTVYVPRQTTRVGEPLSFIKLAFGDGKYQLSWEAPKPTSYFSEPIKNYTIFWCTHDRDRPYQCSGYLSWTEVINKTAYNITVSDDKIHQFAISANTDSSSSGMVWAACTVIHNKAIGKMKNVRINHVYSTVIEVSWKLDCSDRIGRVQGFVIYYCSIVKPSEANCKGPEKNLTIYDPTAEQANITNLKPYETYMLAVSVISKHTSQSPKSDYQYKTTLEDAPSIPLNLTVVNITNSSISITWRKPLMLNGKLKYYHIIYNNITKTVEAEREEYTILNLWSFVTYEISVVACTVECSKPSESLFVKTKGGYPDKITQPGVIFQNDSYILVEWEPPLYPRGNVDIFEVMFKEKLQYENKSNAITNVTATRYAIEDCGADGKYNTFYIAVRAVNFFNGTRYEGPWSDELESFCQPVPNIWIWILIPICIFLVLLLFYMAKRVYLHCQEMRDVEVKLPSGLAPVVPADILLNHWTSPKIQDDQDRRPSADEELLLEKISDSRHLSGDSSGCSSGHESVISSLESTTHLSNVSDSGTEQPHSSSTEELNKNSLRLRNVASRPIINKGYVTMPTDNINTSIRNSKATVTPGSYCVLSIDPTPITSINPSYVPANIASDESIKQPYTMLGASDQPSPYVITGDFNKPSNSGYVPLNSIETMENNPNYVMAGSKNAPLPDIMRLDQTKSTVVDDKPLYVQVSDTSNNFKKTNPDAFTWHPSSSDSMKSTGYVTIGDVPMPRVSAESTKSYIPHRHFDVKAIKED